MQASSLFKLLVPMFIITIPVFLLLGVELHNELASLQLLRENFCETHVHSNIIVKFFHYNSAWNTVR